MSTIEKYRTRLQLHLPRSGDVALVVLKGHLLVEEVLEEIIKSNCYHPDKIIRDGTELGFFLKVRIAAALCPFDMHEMWAAAEALNSLRNCLSHRLEPEKKEARILAFITAMGRCGRTENSDYQSMASEERAAAQHEYLTHSISYLVGSLVALTPDGMRRDTDHLTIQQPSS